MNELVSFVVVQPIMGEKKGKKLIFPESVILELMMEQEQ